MRTLDTLLYSKSSQSIELLQKPLNSELLDQRMLLPFVPVQRHYVLDLLLQSQKTEQHEHLGGGHTTCLSNSLEFLVA